MKTIEYKTEIFIVRGFFGLNGRKNKIQLNERLNEIGRHGWELVTIHQTSLLGAEYILIFKREKVGT